MEDCGGAESHGRGYHVRGVCAVFPVLKGEREERNVRDGRLFSVFYFFGDMRRGIIWDIGNPNKNCSKQGKCCSKRRRTFSTILHSCVASNNCCRLEMRGSMTKCSRISTNERQSCQPVVQ